jgi:nitronate monooxygenase
MQPIRRAAGEKGLADYLNLWSGQAAPLTKARTAAQYFETLVTDTQHALDHRG